MNFDYILYNYYYHLNQFLRSKLSNYHYTFYMYNHFHLNTYLHSIQYKYYFQYKFYNFLNILNIFYLSHNIQNLNIFLHNFLLVKNILYFYMKYIFDYYHQLKFLHILYNFYDNLE